MNDLSIIELYWARDESAIDETDKKYGNYCRKIANNILQNQEDSEECVNDTYLKTWNSIPDDKPNIFSAYLGKITRNLAINKYNKLKAKKRGGGDFNLILYELENCIPSGWSIETKLDSMYIIKTINDFLSSLKKEYRIVFVRRYWYADTIKAISENFNISESNVKSILFRCRKKLKTCLEKEGIEL